MTGSNHPVAPVAAGSVIDGWLLESKLHTGGMATLWAVHRAPGAVAVPAAPAGMALIMKVPRIRGGEDPASIVGFEVEQLIMPTLQGPHVPAFVAKGDFARQPYIVMEHLPGPSLRERLEQAPLALDEVIEVGSRVATALHALHRQGVVHLDVKPSNILFRADGCAVLIDFGLSRHDRLPDLLDEEFTLPMGTGPYMSPEQIRHLRDDPRSDLFALCVMLYHFTTGQRPFGSPSTVMGLRKRLYTDPMPPRMLRPDCPPWLQEIILHGLEVQPGQRFASAAQLALALQYPAQVSLTARAHRGAPQGAVARARRWFRSLGDEPAAQPRRAVAQHLLSCPIVMVAVALDPGSAAAPEAVPALHERLREAARLATSAHAGARLACVSVMKTARIGMDELTDEAGGSLHVAQLVALKHWARPLHRALTLDDSRLTVHVLEAPDVATALVEFAVRNQVDHIVMGARDHSSLRRFLGSVSSQVVAQAPCTVTVVRA